MRRWVPIVLLLLLASVATTPDAGARSSSERADSLHRSADRHLATGSVDGRRIAIEELDQATRLDPHDPDHFGALGRACLEGGWDHRALVAFGRVLSLVPADADAHLGSAQTWKRRWRADFDPSYLDSARVHADAALASRPDGCAERVLVALLAYEQGDMRRAIELGLPAADACPDRYEPALLSAGFAWRTGDPDRAARLFATWIPRLPPELRARFESTVPLLSDDDAFRFGYLSKEEGAEFIRRFWSQSDPDPTTEINEARLEYWARLSYATLLYVDVARPSWDMRGELYSRYGAPGAARYEPMGYPLATKLNRFNFVRFRGEWIPWGMPLWVPIHSMVLEYPQLGMRVLLHDQFLTSNFDTPRAAFGNRDPVPSAAALQQPDLVATPGARAVFPLHAPGVDVIPVATRLSSFQDSRGPHLLAQIEAPGNPDDSLWAEAVVIDSSEHIVARSSGMLAPSACDPATVRASEFDFPLLPGPHRVAIAVHNAAGARGLARVSHSIASAEGALAMSDVVVVCGLPSEMTDGANIRLQPNVARIVNGDDPLVAYFEVYNLAGGEGGGTRFEYRYRIRPEREVRRNWISRLFRGSDDAVLVQSQAEGRESIRRQFIVAPMRTLSSGGYELEVEVHDLNSGTKTSKIARFVKT